MTDLDSDSDLHCLDEGRKDNLWHTWMDGKITNLLTFWDLFSYIPVFFFSLKSRFPGFSLT